MWLAITYLCLILPLLSSAYLVDDVQQSAFETLLKDNKLVLAAFTSKSLVSLTPFRNIFERAAAASKTPFLHIDCAQETDFCKQHDIHAYPAIRLYKTNESGDATETRMKRYRGPKTENAIKSFVKKHEVPVLTHLDPSTHANFKKIDDIVVISYLGSAQVKELGMIRSIAEKHYESFVFGYVTDERVADAEGLAVPAVISYKNTDGDNKAMNGDFNEEDLELFLEMAKKSVIGEFSERTMNDYMAKDKLAVYIFATTENEAIIVRRELTPITKKYEKYVKFGVADAVEYAPMAKNFGLVKDSFPALAVHAPLNDNTFSYRQGRVISSSTVENMLTVILQGQAVSGQVFGDEAPKINGDGGDTVDQGHVEL